LRTLKANIEANLASGYIQQSSSPAAEPSLFAKKKDGWLRVYVDYRALNLEMVHNRYTLPLISDILDGVGEARIFTELDLPGAYNLIRINEGDEYMTDVRRRYREFQYQVMTFCLTNSPAPFQSHINECKRPDIDDFTGCCLTDILIYSTNS
jgi:hypothetical protein